MQHLCVTSCMLPQMQALCSFSVTGVRAETTVATAGDATATTGSQFDQGTGRPVLDSCRSNIAPEVRCTCYAGSQGSHLSQPPCAGTEWACLVCYAAFMPIFAGFRACMRAFFDP